MNKDYFNYAGERFADIQMLRYELPGFDAMPLRDKLYIYCLAEAVQWGRDITFDQHFSYNLPIRQLLERVYRRYDGQRDDADFMAFEVYVKQMWFANGIHHHYAMDKFVPRFSRAWLEAQLGGEDGDAGELLDVIFTPDSYAKRVNQRQGDDLVATSACNFYEGVTQQEAERYYAAKRQSWAKTHPEAADRQPSWGLNSRLVKADGSLKEDVYGLHGRYGAELGHICHWLTRAKHFAQTDHQRQLIQLLTDYYHSGNLETFDDYSILWLQSQPGETVDFINGFIEVYGDPLGLKATWEGIVHYQDAEATHRTATVACEAAWFEAHSPVDPRFRKPHPTGVQASVVVAAMLGGDNYPASAIGINLPNADWIRALHGSKSVTIGNLTKAYAHVGRSSGMLEEFVIDEATRELIRQYGDQTDDLHTDLHECLGHGSGQLLPGTSPDALGPYASTIEEARADLFALYFLADEKLLELGLLPDAEAYKAQYYSYLMNGLLTQLARLEPGRQIEEAHMRNRALIARWALEHADGAVELVNSKQGDGTAKTFVRVNDYQRLRQLFAELLAEIQRVKSEGDQEAARQLVQTYGVTVEGKLHEEVLRRYRALGIAPYKGFINPRMELVTAADGTPADVLIHYDENFAQQQLRYSDHYSTLHNPQ